MIEELLNVVLLTFLIVVALAIARLRTVFPVAMLTGLFSLLAASLFVVLDAVDVALTEAAVGAGVVTVLFLGTFALTRPQEKPVPWRRSLAALAITVATGAGLVYATLDMPHFDTRDTPVQTHPLRDHYLETSRDEIGVPNIVTAVLASYRGFDTLGEVAVIFTAGVAVFMLLGASPRTHDREEDD